MGGGGGGEVRRGLKETAHCNDDGYVSKPIFIAFSAQKKKKKRKKKSSIEPILSNKPCYLFSFWLLAFVSFSI